MAKKKTMSPPVIPPSATPEQGIGLLKQLVEKANTLLSSKLLEGDEVTAWTTLAENYLTKVFGSDSPNVSDVVNDSGILAIPMDADDYFWDEHYKGKMQRRVKILESLVEVLQTEIQLQGGSAPKAEHEFGEKVFVVHGHNEAVLQTTARYIEKLQLEPIILHEQANRGRTIIEKFEQECKGVGFSIILMTGDDRGGLKTEMPEQMRLRARQNVVLEMGFFLGRLGRSRVVVLYEEGVEIPSDYSGVLFIKIDTGGAWRMYVAKEMKAAGFRIDMNLAV